MNVASLLSDAPSPREQPPAPPPSASSISHPQQQIQLQQHTQQSAPPAQHAPLSPNTPREHDRNQQQHQFQPAYSADHRSHSRSGAPQSAHPGFSGFSQPYLNNGSFFEQGHPHRPSSSSRYPPTNDQKLLSSSYPQPNDRDRDRIHLHPPQQSSLYGFPSGGPPGPRPPTPSSQSSPSYDHSQSRHSLPPHSHAHHAHAHPHGHGHTHYHNSSLQDHVFQQPPPPPPLSHHSHSHHARHDLNPHGPGSGPRDMYNLPEIQQVRPLSPIRLKNSSGGPSSEHRVPSPQGTIHLSSHPATSRQTQTQHQHQPGLPIPPPTVSLPLASRQGQGQNQFHVHSSRSTSTSSSRGTKRGHGTMIMMDNTLPPPLSSNIPPSGSSSRRNRNKEPVDDYEYERNRERQLQAQQPHSHVYAHVHPQQQTQIHLQQQTPYTVDSQSSRYRPYVYKGRFDSLEDEVQFRGEPLIADYMAKKVKADDKKEREREDRDRDRALAAAAAAQHSHVHVHGSTIVHPHQHSHSHSHPPHSHAHVHLPSSDVSAERERERRRGRERASSSTSAPYTHVLIPPPPPAPDPPSLGTFVYPSTPLPLAVTPALPHYSTKLRQLVVPPPLYSFTLLVPSRSLLSEVPSVAPIWGTQLRDGTGDITEGTGGYTDDSDVRLCVVHAGFVGMGEMRRMKGERRDLSVRIVWRAAKTVFKGSRGGGLSEEDAQDGWVQSASWGSSHDGGVMEIKAVEWLPTGYAHSRHTPNRKARLAQYTRERARLNLLPSPPPPPDELDVDVVMKLGLPSSPPSNGGRARSDSLTTSTTSPFSDGTAVELELETEEGEEAGKELTVLMEFGQGQKVNGESASFLYNAALVRRALFDSLEEVEERVLKRMRVEADDQLSVTKGKRERRVVLVNDKALYQVEGVEDPNGLKTFTIQRIPRSSVREPLSSFINVNNENDPADDKEKKSNSDDEKRTVASGLTQETLHFTPSGMSYRVKESGDTHFVKVLSWR